MNALKPVGGSFRDPSGHVHDIDGRIVRTVSRHGAPAFRAVRDTGLLDDFVGRGWLVPFSELGETDFPAPLDGAEHVLEHPRIPYVSYPYEWSFPLLKAAALRHLDIQIAAFDRGVVLSDASAYNIQFDGVEPRFIDHLSFRPYAEGDYWLAHGQFCEQFLNPLLLRARLGLSHNAWYRGTQEGISSDHLARMLRLRDALSLRTQLHVLMPARLQGRALASSGTTQHVEARRRALPASAYRGMLTQLRGWIAGLRPQGASKSTWGDYAGDNTYSDEEGRTKSEFVRTFAAEEKPRLMFDLGCNSGAYSEIALDAGAERVVGFDFDQIALERAYARAAERKLPFLPLFLDAANPSPTQGWRQAERDGFAARARADAVVALAFEHHLAIGKNAPLAQVVEWIVSLAPKGIIEFVPREDSTVQSMLANREDIFFDYSAATFEAALAGVARIVSQRRTTASGRTLYRFSRGAG